MNTEKFQRLIELRKQEEAIQSEIEILRDEALDEIKRMGTDRVLVGKCAFVIRENTRYTYSGNVDRMQAELKALMEIERANGKAVKSTTQVLNMSGWREDQ